MLFNEYRGVAVLQDEEVLGLSYTAMYVHAAVLYTENGSDGKFYVVAFFIIKEMNVCKLFLISDRKLALKQT